MKIADNADLGYASKSVSPESVQNFRERSQKADDSESMETSSMQIHVDDNQVEVCGLRASHSKSLEHPFTLFT